STKVVWSGCPQKRHVAAWFDAEVFKARLYPFDAAASLAVGNAITQPSRASERPRAGDARVNSYNRRPNILPQAAFFETAASKSLLLRQLQHSRHGTALANDVGMSTGQRELLARLRARDARVGVVGLGYVGLPLAVEFARSGLTV